MSAGCSESRLEIQHGVAEDRTSSYVCGLSSIQNEHTIKVNKTFVFLMESTVLMACSW